MRMIMTVSMPVEKGNEMMKDGSLPKVIQSILEEQKPEAAYFYAKCGRRTGLIILNLQSESDIPRLAEPWFLAFNASVDFYPAMKPEDLAKAGPSIEQVVNKYAA